MRTRGRTYDDSCGIARALDAVGERWALLIVRELIHGPKRFGELKRGLPGTSPNVLSQRLRDLEDVGVVAHYELEPPASVLIYELTDRGQELAPVLYALGRWGSDQPMTSNNELSADALLAALETMFERTVAKDLRVRIALVLEGEAYGVVVRDGRLDVLRGWPMSPDVTLRTDRVTLRGLAFGGASLDGAVADGRVTLEGPKRPVQRLLAACARR